MNIDKYIKTNRVFPSVSSLALGLTLYKSISYSSVKIHSPLLPDPSKLEISTDLQKKTGGFTPWDDECLDLTHQIFSLMNDGSANRVCEDTASKQFLLPHRRILALTHKKINDKKSKNAFLSENYFAIIRGNIRSYMSRLWNRMGKIFIPFSKNRSNEKKCSVQIVSLGFVLAVACLLFLFASPVFAETISYESALVWRADTSGDYTLPKIAAQSTHITDLAIVTKGLIETITATWKSEGDVQMSVSADDGLHFTPVVNGVPLVAGFVEGTNLKWKAIVGSDGKLNEVRIVYTDSSGVVGSFGNPELDNFKYRKSFRITGPEGKGLFNYQVRLRVAESGNVEGALLHCDAHVLADFKDIRFTLSDGETTLPYYLEKIEGEKPNRTAEFLVKVPQLPDAGLILYLYYGNPIAENASNPKETFDLYDDFSAGALDSELWQERLSPGGSVAVSKDGLKVDAASVTSKAFEFAGGILEVAATAQTGFETRLIIRDPDPASETDIAQVAYASAYSGAEHCVAVGNFVKANDAKPIAAGTKYIYRVIADGKDLTFERYSDGFGEKQAEVSYKDEVGPSKGFVGLKAAGAGRGESLTTFHWVRVRKYASPEPQVDAAKISKEQDFVSPVFTNTVLAANGDLILAEGQTTGAYVTKDAAAPYKIRILVPSWNGEGVSVDISADSGKTYKKNCTNNAYYYAAKGDFVSGDNIKCRVTFKKGAASSVSRLEFVAVQYALGSIVVLAPNAGDSFSLGSQTEIKWTAWDYEKAYPMKIEYALDAGKTFTTIVKQTENDGSYIWSVPKDADLLTKEAMIRISDSYDNKTQATSKIFSIVPAVLKPGETTAVTTGQAPSEKATVSIEAKQAEKEWAAERIDLGKLIEKGKRPGAKLYDLLIKIGDNYSPDPEENERACYKEGDIVVVKPAGHLWSDNERISFLIIQVYLTEKEAEGLTRPKEIATGKVDASGRPIMKQVNRRLNRIDLKKLGLSKTDKKAQELQALKNLLMDKPLASEVIEAK